MLKTIANGVQNGRYIIVDNAAHLPNVEHPDVISRAIAEHIERAATTSS